MAKRKWTNEEVKAYRNEHGGVGYFNKEDSNIFVPKAYGFGSTINLGNPIAWIIILILAGFIAWRIFSR